MRQFVFLCVVAASCGAAQVGDEVRPPAVAGRFYPADKGQLVGLLDRCLARSPDYGKLEPLALVSPHAGFVYSGACAACGYGILRGKQYKRVIVLGPSHYGAFRGAGLVPYRTYRTPLGDVPIDVDAVKALRRHELFSLQPASDRREHSIEVQVPFLQRVLSRFTLLPILIGSITEPDYGRIAAALKPYVDGSTLVVVSSDFTHFGTRFNYVPYRTGIRDRIETLDFGAIEFIVNGDRKGWCDYVRRTGATICGRNPIGVLLELLPGRWGPQPVPAALLSYVTSADKTGGTSDYHMLGQGSVSYASVVFLKPGSRKGKQTVEPLDLLPHDKPLDRECFTRLLGLARQTIRSYLAGKRETDLGSYVNFGELPDEAKYRAGAFVTLKKKGILRRCIGAIQPRQPLWEAVVGNAIHAAVHDRRFPAVTAEELDDLDIEISVLTAPREVPGPQEFRVGTHGIIIEKEKKRAVFLPQVAPEQGWDRDETLTHLARKAGLPGDAWREGTRFWIFEAQVHGENEG